MIDKNWLRSKTLSKRNLLQDRSNKSNQICKTIMDSNAFQTAKTVFVYLSFKSEVETKNIIDTCFNKGKLVCVPVVKQGGLMDAVAIENTLDLVYNIYNICEPKDKTKIVDKSKIDLCIVPGSVFDTNLNRIGYGKGFYDRFLYNTNIKKVALAFDCQIVKDLPVEQFDVKMDAIVTETKVIGTL